jgi:hypothetical protein
MKTYVQLFLKIMHPLSIMEFWSLKIWIYFEYLGCQKNFTFEFHSKLFVAIEYGLKIEIIKLDLEFFLKP